MFLKPSAYNSSMRSAVIATFAFLLVACATKQTSLIFDRLEPCTSDQGPTDSYCGFYEVFENRDTGEGRKIALKVVVLPAYSAGAAPDPVFFFAGGPGQGAASIAGMIDGLFRDVRKSRDIVLIDQRGTGGSGRLDCKPYEDDDEEPPPDFIIPESKIRECLDSYDADVRLYTTPIAMDDINDVRAWLGYDKINLYGGSYGTRAALVYLRRHEDTVRSVVLDGVAPTDMTMPLYMPRDFDRALSLVFQNCAQDADCNKRFPDLREQLDSLLDSLDKNKPKVNVKDPRTGESREETASKRAVLTALAGALYSPWTSALIPLIIDRASNGDYSGLAALGGAGGAVAESMAQGMFYSVTCSEDYPRLDRAMVDRESAGTELGAILYETRWGPCQYWPRGEVSPDYYKPVQSDVPVLLLSGELDPVTPPRWAEHVREHLTNARHIVAPGVAHGVAPVGCAIRLIGRFYETADPASVDPSCLDDLTRPPFFVNPTGPYVEEEKKPEEKE